MSQFGLPEIKNDLLEIETALPEIKIALLRFIIGHNLYFQQVGLDLWQGSLEFPSFQ